MESMDGQISLCTQDFTVYNQMKVKQGIVRNKENAWDPLYTLRCCIHYYTSE